MYLNFYKWNAYGGIFAAFSQKLFLLALLFTFSGAAVAAEKSVAGYDRIKQKFQALKHGVPAIAPAANGTLRIIVKAKRTATEPVTSRNGTASLARIEHNAIRHGAKVRRKISRHNLLAVQLTETQFESLIASGDIQTVREDLLIKPQLNVSVPFIHANLVHNAGYTGAGTAVAILDTGIQADHEFFGGRVVEEACFSSGGDGVNSFNLCPNGQTSQIGPGAAQGCQLQRYSDACYHGTHVAGIAAGRNTFMSGVAPGAKIVAVQVFTFYPGFGLFTWSSDLVAAYDWLLNAAATPNIAAINMSLSGGAYTGYCDSGDPLAPLIETLRTRGTASTVATGNNGLHDAIGWPSCISSAVAVGAIERDVDVIANYSNVASIMDLLAPGSGIYSSVYDSSYNAYYSSFWGTSMAAPHVAGAFATLKSFKPAATIDQIEQSMKSSAVPVYDPISGLTFPRIDVYAAYQQLSSDTPCALIPGVVTMNAGNFHHSETKSWNVLAKRGGLFRVWLTSAATGGSNELRLDLRERSVNLSVAAGQSILADFANVPAGQMELRVTSLSNNLSLSEIRVEQLATNDSTASGSCHAGPILIPGVVTVNAGRITQGETISWTLRMNAAGNVRIVFVGNTTQSSGSIVLNFNGSEVPLSFNPGQTVIADFANIPAGDRALSITATTNGVSIGRVEAQLY